MTAAAESSVQSGGTPAPALRGSNPPEQRNRTKNRTPVIKVPPHGDIRSNHGKLDVNFVQINTNKSYQAFNDLASYLVQRDNPIVLVQEPHVNSRNVISRPSRDLALFSKANPTRRPRACIFTHINMRNKVWLMDSLSNEDCVVIQSTINNTKTLIVSCYMDREDTNCPPDYLPPVVNYARQNNMALVIGTDANAHHRCWNSLIINDKGRGDQLLDFMAKENLSWENTGSIPTFDNGRWKNIIDLTITNTKGHELVSNWWVHAMDKIDNSSDHNFINFKAMCGSGMRTSKFRDISKTDWDVYRSKLESLFANSTLATRMISTQVEIDDAGDEFTALITSAFHASCEEHYVSSKIRKPPWETKEVGEAKKEIRHKLRLARNTKADKSWEELRSHQAQYKKLVKNARTSSWRDFCKELDSKSNSKKISSIVKNTKTARLGTVRKPDGKLTESPEETLDIMTKVHFKDGVTLSNSSPSHNVTAPIISSPKEESVWDPSHIFSERRIKKAIAEFDPLTAAGPDGIRPVMLQRGWDIVGQSLVNIIKTSYAKSFIPNCWKNSTGIFLPKPGKNDYYNPKAYRTITLAPVPLKLLERVVQWHMEVDLKMDAVLHRNQFGFRKGLSTEAALHSIVNKIENQIKKGEFALGTFLDIEGAFDNVSFTAISRALEKYCPSSTVNNWIKTMIKSRSTTVELNGVKRTIISKRGCPQGGILSPLLWNLVMNNLFFFTRDKLPCDLQGFADDLLLMACGFDADTLRDVTQRSLRTVEEWCRDNDLALSSAKTHSVMFTWKRKWKLAKPLRVSGLDIELKETTKFLGVTLDHKLSWNPHIEKQTNKAKGVLMMCKRALGPTWGFSPATMKWIYTSIVRPMLCYGAAIWINGLRTQKNLSLLSSVQRLSHIMTTGGMPSTSLVSLDKLLNFTSIETHIKEQAAICAARLKALNIWVTEPAATTKGRLRNHSSILEEIHQNLPFHGTQMDLIKPHLNLETNFNMEIPAREDYPDILSSVPPSTVQCFTDGSKMEDKVGAGYTILSNDVLINEESFHLGSYSTVFQAEVMAVSKAASYLLDKDYSNETIIIYCDSKSALQAVDSCKIRSLTTLQAVSLLNRLGASNDLHLKWIPAHSNFAGNERADTLAKMGSKGDSLELLTPPTPQVIWKTNIHNNSLKEMEVKWSSVAPCHFKRMWRKKFAHGLANLNRKDLRIATQILTGHAAVNYHLHKYKPNLISKTCPFCNVEDETINHFIGKCPQWAVLRGRFFNTFYASSSDIMDTMSIHKIIDFARATKRLDPDFKVP